VKNVIPLVTLVLQSPHILAKTAQMDTTANQVHHVDSPAPVLTITSISTLKPANHAQAPAIMICVSNQLAIATIVQVATTTVLILVLATVHVPQMQVTMRAILKGDAFHAVILTVYLVIVMAIAQNANLSGIGIQRQEDVLESVHKVVSTAMKMENAFNVSMVGPIRVVIVIVHHLVAVSAVLIFTLLAIAVRRVTGMNLP
jgi:hypothetical protein